MGRPALEEKLDRELSSADEMTEARVVYMLVAIRKLLEIGNNAGTYPSLNLHCNWALHSRLDGKAAVNLIKLFDDLEEARGGGEAGEIESAKRALDAITGAERFRLEFRQFLKSHDLPVDLCALTSHWLSFLNVYGQIISDVPLEFTMTAIRRVAKVVVRHIEAPMTPELPGSRFAFALNWTPVRFDAKETVPHISRIFRFGFGMTPSGRAPRDLSNFGQCATGTAANTGPGATNYL
jgi:hypothetical protein